MKRGNLLFTAVRLPNKQKPYLLGLLLPLAIFVAYNAFSSNHHPPSPYDLPSEAVLQDTIPLEERYDDHINSQSTNPFDLNDPKVIKKEVEYDPETNQYIITERIGNDYFRMPTYMTFEEYLEYKNKQQQEAYFQKLGYTSDNKKRSRGQQLAENLGFDPDNPLGKIDIQKSLADRLFGGTGVDIRPQGSIDITLGLERSTIENPVLTQRQQRPPVQLLFEMVPQIDVSGSIGEKLNLNMNYDQQASFDFDRQIMKLEYASDAFSEDDIIKTIEAGNVSLPLQGQLIQGAQSLFGLKTQLQFGRLFVTGIASQQKSEREEIQIKGGSQVQEFEVFADEYDENRNFLLSHFNRENFNESLANLPQIISLFNIKRIDVWVTNDRNVTTREGEPGPRDIVALSDLGEGNAQFLTNPSSVIIDPTAPKDINQNLILPNNDANDLYKELQDQKDRVRKIDQAVAVLQNQFGLQQARDFEKVAARRLREGSEFTVNKELGFVSLNINLQQDQVLGVAFEYSYNGNIYTVGEMYGDAPATGVAQDSNEVSQDVLFVKMLKSTTPRVDIPLWDLMMKNFYNIGAYQVDRKDFKLDVYYEDTGDTSSVAAPNSAGRGRKRFLPTSNPDQFSRQPLIRLLNLDNLNVQGDPGPDGVFDYVPGLTIYPRTGRIMFPTLEPFGQYLEETENPLTGEDLLNARDKERFVYQELYDSTVIIAREYPELNRFSIRGEYRSSISNEISLGAFNIPPGSVRVTAGGKLLVEGQDYEIDYSIGRVRILNDAYLSSGVPINVSFEDNTLFGFQTKTMVGLRADYKFNKNFILGGTYLQLLERPFTQKVNIGDDPINNKIYGLDLNYSGDAPWLTRLVDNIPFIDTKAPSTVSISAEAAALRPGHSRAINEQGGEDKGGILYLDDFEGTANGIPLGIAPANWVIASVPQGTSDGAGGSLFPEADLINDLRAGANRAQINWYRIDPILQNEQQDANPYTARIGLNEVFPNRTITPNQQNNAFTFDLTYNPSERGPYNFDVPNGYPGISEGLTQNGRLRAPETRWGGIMTDLNLNNFEQANVEFIEFWLLSPFLEYTVDENGTPVTRQNTTGGDMYIDLGNVSEDILRDSRRFYENGLPGPANPDRRTTSTEWARVPIAQQVTNGFDLEEENRAAQDVGLDGLNNAREQEQYSEYLDAVRNGGVSGNDLANILADPSNDDFIHYRQYQPDVPVLERYSRFNGQENNSQSAATNVNTNEQLPNSSNQFPDEEDLNDDNTMNETEAYFQYKVSLRPRADGGIAASEFITDEREGLDGRRWYRFRIPLRDKSRKSIGGIQDLRSIRFVRMYLKDFQQSATLRFARMELVRNQWRTYLQDLSENPSANAEFTEFDINAVNIEENSSRCPFNYVLPPDIQREQLISAFVGLQNEQSITMQVKNLRDGDAKAIYKTLNLDLRNYDRLKMFVHAEKTGYDLPEINCVDSEEDINCDPTLEDGDLSVFMRLGSDFTENYYEYEIPLTISDPEALPNLGTGTVPDAAYIDEVWKKANEFDFELDWLVEAKKARNKEAGLGVEYEFPIPDRDTTKAGHRIKIKGNPNLGYVKTVMIGIRNPKVGRDANDDGNPHCVEIWINELRMQGLNEQGGVAATARVDLQLADFGNISASANYSSIGFGALNQQLDERSLEELSSYDVAANFELSRFLPSEWGLRLPAYAAYAKEISKPKFDPYDLDILLEENLAEAETAEERKEMRERSQEVTTIKSVSMTNVGKDRTSSSAPMPWDISNFSATYAYTEIENTDPLIEYDRNENHQGTIDYTYALPTKPIEPFKGLPDNDWLKVLRDLNFNPLPNSFAFSTTIYREQSETKYRFTDLDPVFSTFYNKQFTWDRTFDLQWDFAKALKINFSSINFSVIDEPNEADLRIANPNFSDEQIKGVIRDSIITNIQDFGRPKIYTHNLNVNFTAPFRAIPLLDWINVKAQYSSDYGWAAGALNIQEQFGLGNIIQNSQQRQVNADFSFDKLYDKWGYLKKINRPARRNARSSRGRTGSRSSSRGGKEDDKKKKKKEREITKIERALIRPLLLARKARFNYSESFATVVPGFRPNTNLLGLSSGFNAPGWDFVAGLQPTIRTLDVSEYGTEKDWLHQISNVRGEDSWITNSVFLNQEVIQQYNQTMDGQLTLEPIPDFRIDIEIQRSFTENHAQSFKDTLDDGINNWLHRAPTDVGSLTLSYFALNTFFGGSSDRALVGLFEQYEQNRLVASQLLGKDVHDDPVLAGEGYTNGYGRVQLDVLLPAFMAAYTGKSINDVGVQIDYADNKLFKELPLPNWRLSYNGLSKLPIFQEIFQNVNITHSYRSQLAINSFNTRLKFIQNDNGGVNRITQDFYSRLEIPEIVIQEAFAPLIGLDIRTQNDMSIRFNYNRSRSLAMSFVSNQLAETQSVDYQAGFGWLLSDVNIGFLRNMVNNNPNKKKQKSEGADDPLNFPGNNRIGRGGGGGGANVGDLNINIDFSLRDDVTFNHLLDQDIREPTRGNKQISFSPSAEYQMHERLALRLFFDYSRTVPRVSTAFPITNTAGGIVVRFTLNN